MIRARENPLAIQAGLLALLMHGLFLFVLIFSFSWKHVRPPSASEVQLWDSLPKPVVVTPPPQPEVKPEPPPPEVKPEIKPEIKPEPPEPPPEPKAEIQVKPKPVIVKKPPKEEPKKPDPAIKKQAEEKKHKEELDKLKKAMLQDVPDQETPPPTPAVDTKAQEAQKAADAKRAEEILAASSGVINDYVGRITAKILSHVNSAVCGSGKPSLTFTINVLPGGNVNGNPQQTKSSGLPACDLEVEHAILLSQPLPLPPQRELFDQFRTLNLTFRPNGK
jgi:colicin import membrane protein